MAAALCKASFDRGCLAMLRAAAAISACDARAPSASPETGDRAQFRCASPGMPHVLEIRDACGRGSEVRRGPAVRTGRMFVWFLW